MIDKIIEWIESNKWGKKLMIEIARRLIEKFIFSLNYDGFEDIQVFFDWLDKEGE